MKRKKVLAVVLAALLCAGAVSAGAATTAFAGDNGATLVDIRYAETATDVNRQLMDIYLPGGKTAADAILFIHGGGWMIGDKGFYTQACMDIQALGYAAATMNYRFLGYFNNNSAATMLNDIDIALHMLVSQAAAQGTELKSVALMGDSAGAHLALLYAYTQYETAALPISFVVSMVGPSDFLDPGFVYAEDGLYAGMRYFALALAGVPFWARNSDTESYLLHEEALRAVSPIYHVKPGVPPSLLAYGGQDDFVPPSNGVNLYESLRNAGVPTDMFFHENSGHFLGDAADSEVSEAFFAMMLEYAQTYGKAIEEPPETTTQPTTTSTATTTSTTTTATPTTTTTTTTVPITTSTTSTTTEPTTATTTTTTTVPTTSTTTTTTTTVPTTTSTTITTAATTTTSTTTTTTQPPPPPPPPIKGIFGTNARWTGAWWHYVLFFVGFGFIWMWF